MLWIIFKVIELFAFCFCNKEKKGPHGVRVQCLPYNSRVTGSKSSSGRMFFFFFLYLGWRMLSARWLEPTTQWTLKLRRVNWKRLWHLKQSCVTDGTWIGLAVALHDGTMGIFLTGLTVSWVGQLVLECSVRLRTSLTILERRSPNGYNNTTPNYRANHTR